MKSLPLWPANLRHLLSIILLTERAQFWHTSTATVLSLKYHLPGGHCQCHCTHILYISLNKYDCHIAILSYPVNMLNGYVDPPFLYICTRTQSNVINTSHHIAKYVLETNMPTQLGIQAKYLMGLYIYEVIAINHATRRTVHILSIYH